MAVDPPTPVPQRPSDAERELVIDVLREGCQSERLSLDTFSDRVQRAYDARSRAQLDALVLDLPAGSALGRSVLGLVARLSRLAAGMQAAWRDPRTPDLALPVTGLVVLGRSRRCDCVLADPTVSRRHASLRHTEGTWWLRDLHSINGTLVNGRRLTGEVEVRAGDRVSFGASTYRLGPPY